MGRAMVLREPVLLASFWFELALCERQERFEGGCREGISSFISSRC